jgi:hypothetical protein
MTEYWVCVTHRSGASPSVVHSDKHCPMLEKAHGSRPAADAEVERYDVCESCRGEYGGSDTGADFAHYNAAVNAEVAADE